MDIKHVYTVMFSPTGTSRKVAQAVAAGIAHEVPGVACTAIDLTTDYDCISIIELEDAVCVVAAPVYGGLLPPLAVDRLRRIVGTRSVALPVVVYGNRDYEDALMQLGIVLTNGGFGIAAGATFVGEHSYSRPEYPIAAGRPDAADLDKAEAFGRRAAQLIAASTAEPSLMRTQLPGNNPVKTLPQPTHQIPVVNDKCNTCLKCISICPTAAIVLADSGIRADFFDCIKCCACVKQCPQGALTFDTPYSAMLSAKCTVRREPEIFWGIGE